MARPLRIEYPGALYHVMNRGNRRERVLVTFPWSSFPALIGLRTASEWLKTADILNGFGTTPRQQASGYRR